MPLDPMLEGTPIGEMFHMAAKRSKGRKAEARAKRGTSLESRLKVLRKMRKERGFPHKRGDD